MKILDKKKLTIANVVFCICLISSISLIIGGFFVPPVGVIDGSVLTAVGELFAFATLAQIPTVVRGRSVTLTHGNTTMEIGDDDNNTCA